MVGFCKVDHGQVDLWECNGFVIQMQKLEDKIKSVSFHDG